MNVFSFYTKTKYVYILVFGYTITLSDYFVTVKPKTNNLSKIIRMHLDMPQKYIMTQYKTFFLLKLKTKV